ncbi:hypothetical protein [Streptomyces apocyni]|uniref:hypothetical protein n=1 Tax=Streptomyces apocyni TaxID=2654677 RepID=UPI0012EA7F93|nr:hypothetical protein [Streptomyces apocyni]
MRKSLAVTLAAGAAVLSSAGAASAHYGPAEALGLDDSGNVAQSYGTKVVHGEGLTQGFGDTAIKRQVGVINQNGAPLVNLDVSCPAPWMGGVIHGTIGNNYAACNTDEVSQVKTGGLIG